MNDLPDQADLPEDQSKPGPAVASPAAKQVEPASPCVSVCALDENDVCLGCYRTTDEITDWFMANAAEKHAILARAEARRVEANPVRLA